MFTRLCAVNVHAVCFVPTDCSDRLRLAACLECRGPVHDVYQRRCGGEEAAQCWVCPDGQSREGKRKRPRWMDSRCLCALSRCLGLLL